MEPALKQRLIGGAVLVALAVIFLPMLIKGPATESGAADVSLDMPDAPRDGMTTRTIPLGAPTDAGAGGAVGLDAEPDTLPTVDTRQSAPGGDAMLPAATAGGNYAVSFGSWATPADADRVIAALRAQQLVAYREAATNRTGRGIQRVRIGPFASEAEAEAARIRAGRVRADLGAQVVVLDAGAVPLADPRMATAGTATPTPPIPVVATPPVSTPPASTPAPLATAALAKPTALPAAKPSTPTAVSVTAAAIKATPVATPTPAPVPATKPAAGNVGYAVQLGAFSKAEDADKLRDKLRAAGFNAFVEGVRSDKGALSRVRVGPVATRAEADALKSQVASRAGVSGDVRAHP